MSNKSNESVSVGCGCGSLILTIVALWALVFGWTYNGQHHQLGCSCAKGVEVK